MKGRPNTKRQWIDKELFKACMFAKTMTDNGESWGLACYKAGQYYGFSASDVAWGRNQLKQVSSKHSNKRRP